MSSLLSKEDAQNDEKQKETLTSSDHHLLEMSTKEDDDTTSEEAKGAANPVPTSSTHRELKISNNKTKKTINLTALIPSSPPSLSSSLSNNNNTGKDNQQQQQSLLRQSMYEKLRLEFASMAHKVNSKPSIGSNHIKSNENDDESETEEDAERLANFNRVYDMLLLDNESELSFQREINMFALWTDHELDQVRNGFVPLEEDETSENRVRIRMRRMMTALPESLDWSEENYVTTVKEQGFCGGCWSFAATGLLESHFALSVTSSENPILISLSEQELLSCDVGGKNRGCQGGNYYHALKDYIALNGITSGRLFPYSSLLWSSTSNSLTTTCQQPQRVLTMPPPIEIAFVDRNEQAMMEALQNGPVAVALAAYNSVFQYYHSGILDDAIGCGTKVDHAALLVGYGVDEDTGKKFWLVKNSWGKSWGWNGGYVKLIRGSEQVLQQTNGLGICGIMTQANTLLLSPPKCVFSNVTQCSLLGSNEFCIKDYGCDSDISTGVNNPNNGGGAFTPLEGFGNNQGSSSFMTIVTAVSIVCGILIVLIGFAIFLLIRERKSRRERDERTTMDNNNDVNTDEVPATTRPEEEEADKSQNGGVLPMRSPCSTCTSTSAATRDTMSFDFDGGGGGASPHHLSKNTLKKQEEDDEAACDVERDGSPKRTPKTIHCKSPIANSDKKKNVNSQSLSPIRTLFGNNRSQPTATATVGAKDTSPSSIIFKTSFDYCESSSPNRKKESLDDELILRELREQILPSLTKKATIRSVSWTDKELWEIFSRQANRDMNRTCEILAKSIHERHQQQHLDDQLLL